MIEEILLIILFAHGIKLGYDILKDFMEK